MKPFYPSYLQHPFPFLEVNELAKLTIIERDYYQENLKTYRDLKNVIDTAFGDGKIEGIIEGEKKGELATILK